MSRQKAIVRSAKDQEYLKQLGENIREARKRKGYSQEVFAEMAGFSRSYYTEIETGKRNISILNFAKILQVLDIDSKEITNIVK